MGDDFMKFQFRFHEIHLDAAGFTREVNRTIRAVMKEALHEWLVEAVKHIPIFTGMSIGSLEPVARKIGKHIKDYRSVKIHPNAVKYPNKTFEEGAAGTTVDIISDGRHNYVNVDVTTFHYILNEFTDQSANFNFSQDEFKRPWESFKHARGAFLRYMRKHLKDRLPKVKDFVGRTEVHAATRYRVNDAGDLTGGPLQHGKGYTETGGGE